MVIEPTDWELLDAHRAGDRSAFRTLFTRHRDGLTTFAWRLLDRREEAEEVVVDAFVRLMSQPPQPQGSLRAWLYTVVHRSALDRLRRRSRWGRVWDRLAQWVAPDVASPFDRVAEDEVASRLARALAALPEPHRVVLLLFYADELPTKEIAQILDCDDQQVRSRLSYARRLLRDAWGEP